MKKTASGLEYVDEKEGTGETPKDRPDLPRPLHRLALGEEREGQEIR